MKKILIIITVMFFGSLFRTIAGNSSENDWTKRDAKRWFKEEAWLNGLDMKPHKSIDVTEFARQYHINKKYWDQAFNYLKTHDLKNLAKGKYVVDGDNVTVSVTEDPSKDLDKTNWESHRKYVDLQSVIIGEEKIGVNPVSKSTVTKEYDAAKDVANYSSDGKLHKAKPGTFFLFFPTDAHRPNITPGGNKVVKKIVIKIRAAE
jgi:biofilm protein TabA